MGVERERVIEKRGCGRERELEESGKEIKRETQREGGKFGFQDRGFMTEDLHGFEK